MSWLAIVSSILCLLIGINIGVLFMAGLQVKRRQDQESTEAQLRARIRELEATQASLNPALTRLRQEG